MFEKVVFFNDPATTEIYTLSLHDALPISPSSRGGSRRTITRFLHPGAHSTISGATSRVPSTGPGTAGRLEKATHRDRKSTRLNSSHANISYAVFCLKKKTTYANDSPTLRL